MAIPQGGTLLYYGTDHLGSVRDVMATQNGTKVASYDYDPYGNQIAGSGRISVDFRYAQMFYHQQSGLYLTNFRAYDPKTTRWLSRDPIGETGGINLYSYVAGNPVSYIDPLGLAYFAVRPLEGLPWLGPLSNNPLDNAMNTAIAHEQLFFEDGKSPSNIGFFDDSKLKTENLLDGYRRLPGQYNDCVMRMATRVVNTGKYSLIGNNCQSWTDRVREQYDKLMQSGLGAVACGL